VREPNIRIPTTVAAEQDTERFSDLIGIIRGREREVFRGN